MKNINEILAQGSTTDIIDELKKKNIVVPKWEELVKEYEPKLHAIIADKAKYPDKPIYDNNDNIIKTEPITRVAIGLQKLAVKRMSEFMFTIPANPICEDADTDKQIEEQFTALKKVLKKNKWKTLNKKRCKIISSQCEQATYWYVVQGKEKHNLYGFETTFKLKCAVFCPENGDTLFPLFDEMGDMIAFSREFAIQDGDKKTQYFETWTSDKYIRWRQESGSEWTVDTPPTVIQIGKIPLVYGYRKNPIWDDADNGKVSEIELLLSRNGDIIAYHAAPVLIIKGELAGAPSKSEANKVFTTDTGGGAEYVSWQQSPESVKFQFETLLRMYFTELQLPDLSFENIKGLGAASGEARKWLLADAHLKVGDESEIYEDIIDREYSIIKAYLGAMNTRWKDSINDLEIETEITPFIISDEKTKVEVLVAANGGKPLVSQERSVELAGFSEKPGDDFIKIKAEYAEENVKDILEPTF
ncbi:phage portal protein [Dyadobacter bucti]|uniref:phage portal protein n=1 Tax=Dyadobacter bucti TaxID=2572203 RepID=UPI001108D8DA|nr:phage portal protein [Dyadobacter bucti]